jgi:Tetratricopeptide repeat
VRSCLPTARPCSTTPALYSSPTQQYPSYSPAPAATLGRGLDMRLAVELHEQALAMWQQLHDGDHQSVAHSLTLLAIDLRVLREYGRARKLDEQALAMNQRLGKQ